MSWLPEGIDFFRPKELAEWLGYTEAYIYKLRKQGVLHFEIIGGLNFIHKDEVARWLNDHCNIPKENDPH